MSGLYYLPSSNIFIFMKKTEPLEFVYFLSTLQEPFVNNIEYNKTCVMTQRKKSMVI